jgi:hypothetical protein
MSDNVAADGFTSVSAGKQCRSSWVGLDLVGDEDGDVELLGHVLQTSKMDAQLGLAILQFSTADVVDAEEGAYYKWVTG